MYHQNHVLNALRATAYTADPSPDAFVSDWNSEGLPEADVGRYVPGDDFISTGNEKLDAIVRAAHPRFHYGFRAAYSQHGEGDIYGNPVPGSTYDYIAFPPLSAFRGQTEREKRAGYMRTLAHELVHWTQGKGRGGERRAEGMSELTRLLAQLEGRPPEGYVKEELTAEMGATLLLDAVGADLNMPARASYVANWLSAAPQEARERLLDAAEAQAKRAVNWLLEKAHVAEAA